MAFVVNELLWSLKCNFGKLPRTDIISTFADFYSGGEVEGAKQVLVDFAEKCNPKLDELKKVKARMGEGKARREIEDILFTYTALDARKEALPEFVVADTGRVPSLKEIDLCKMSADITAKVSNIESVMRDQFDKLNVLLINNLEDTQNIIQAKIDTHFKQLTSFIESELGHNVDYIHANAEIQLNQNVKKLESAVIVHLDKCVHDYCSKSGELTKNINQLQQSVDSVSAKITSAPFIPTITSTCVPALSVTSSISDTNSLQGVDKPGTTSGANSTSLMVTQSTGLSDHNMEYYGHLMNSINMEFITFASAFL